MNDRASNPQHGRHVGDAPQAPAPGGTSRPRLLLVDDSPTQLAVLVSLLQDHCEIQVAKTGQQGLALACAAPPDLILLDVQMPGMDGHAVARALRAHASTQQVPFIFLTADGATQAERVGLELGATDYIAKPVHGEVALRRILNHLEREKLRQQVEADRAELEARVVQRTADLERARNEAQAASRLKDAILRNLSHELRTPLNGVLGMLALLRRQLTDAPALRRIALAEESARRLDAVLMGLLDLAQLEAGLIRVQAEPYRIGDIVDRVAASLQPLAAANGMALVASTEPGCAALTCVGDPARVQQIVEELARNAIKFSRQGTVTLVAKVLNRTEPDGGEARELQVAVSDHGPGVDPGRAQAIYEPFVQLDATTTRDAEGNGVGLALAQGLARLMRGRVELQANSAAGATFALCLPCQPPVAA